MVPGIDDWLYHKNREDQTYVLVWIKLQYL